MLAHEALTWIESTLGAHPGDAGIQVLNAAGEAMVDCHEWRWLEREGTVSITADQDYASLPADFRGLLRSHESNSFSDMRSGTLEQMVALKSAGFSGQQFFTGVVTYRTVSGIPTPVLRLDPTPENTEADAFNIAYLAGWTELAAGGDTVAVPAWMENLYRQFVVAYARGFDEEDNARTVPGQLIEEHLMVMMNGKTYKAAVNRDELINPTMGTPRHGWIQSNNRRYGGTPGRGYLRTRPGLPT